MICRDASKRDWTAPEKPTVDEIKIGSLQRIADAVELVAKNYLRLIDDRNMWERTAAQRARTIDSLRRREAGLRGTITRMKKERSSKPCERRK